MKPTEKLLKNPVLSVVLALLCQAVWATGYVLIKLGYKAFAITDVNQTLLFASCRFMLAGAILLIYIWIKDKKFPLPDKSEYGRVLCVSFFQTMVPYGLQFPAMIFTSSLHCSILNGTQFIFASIFASMFFAEDKLTGRKIIASIIAFCGILFCFLYDGKIGSISFKGEGLMLISIASFALSVSFFKKNIVKTNTTVCTGYSLFLGGLLFFIIAVCMGGHIENGGFPGMISIIGLALMSSICMLIWSALVKYNDVGKIAVCQCINPITGAICATLVLGENVFQIKYIVALILITTGIIIYNRKS